MAHKRKDDEAYKLMIDIIGVFSEHGCSSADAMLACIQTLCVIATREGRDYRDLPEAVDMIVGELQKTTSWHELLTGMGKSMN
jgi:hypothetical protein